MKELWKNLKRAWVYSKSQKKFIIGYMILNIISIIINIFVPILGAEIIVRITDNQFKQVIMIAIIILLVEVLRNLILYLIDFFQQRIYRESFINIQTSLGREILKIENACIDENGSGVFIRRLTNDASKIAEIFNVLNTSLTNIITNIGIFTTIFIINKIIFLYLVITSFIIFLIEKKRIMKRNEEDKIYRKNDEKVSGFIGELVRGVRDIKMLNAEDSFIETLHGKIVDLNTQRYSMNQVNRNYNFHQRNLSDLFYTGNTVLSVLLIMANNLTVANALVIHNYMGMLSSVVFFVSMLLEKVKDFNLSSARIFSIIDGDEFKKETFGTKHLDKVDGNFEFKNVSFGYNDKEKVLKDVSFKIKANETVAFVGKSGSGKSTIFSLLCKMYNINQGMISIDGVDIRELDKESIRGNITIISQNPYIFNMSIRDNLKLVKKDLTDEEMIDACKLACLHDFIESLPEKYDTILGEGGINLSGGQRQRVAIARVFVQKTEIILFDEATSALDNETQASIQQAIANLQNKYTILIIAHRLSTVVNSDRIIFLNEGKIEDEGTHKQLLASNKDYKQLYEAEMKK